MCLFKNDQLTLVDVLLHAVAREDTHAKAAQASSAKAHLASLSQALHAKAARVLVPDAHLASLSHSLYHGRAGQAPDRTWSLSRKLAMPRPQRPNRPMRT